MWFVSSNRVWKLYLKQKAQLSRFCHSLPVWGKSIFIAMGNSQGGYLKTFTEKIIIIIKDVDVTGTHHHICFLPQFDPNLTFDLKYFENYLLRFIEILFFLFLFSSWTKWYATMLHLYYSVSVNNGLCPASRFFQLSYGGHLWFVDCGHQGADINCLPADLNSPYSN